MTSASYEESGPPLPPRPTWRCTDPAGKGAELRPQPRGSQGATMVHNQGKEESLEPIPSFLQKSYALSESFKWVTEKHRASRCQKILRQKFEKRKKSGIQCGLGRTNSKHSILPFYLQTGQTQSLNRRTMASWAPISEKASKKPFGRNDESRTNSRHREDK